MKQRKINTELMKSFIIN